MKIKIARKTVAELKITQIKSSKPEKKEKSETLKITINNQLFLNTKNSKLFRIRYLVNLTLENNATFDLVYDFDFSADEDVEAETLGHTTDVRSHAPAMAWPYIKGYLENITAMSGLGSINLPFFDFIAEPLEVAE